MIWDGNVYGNLIARGSSAHPVVSDCLGLVQDWVWTIELFVSTNTCDWVNGLRGSTWNVRLDANIQTRTVIPHVHHGRHLGVYPIPCSGSIIMFPLHTSTHSTSGGTYIYHTVRHTNLSYECRCQDNQLALAFVLFSGPHPESWQWEDVVVMQTNPWRLQKQMKHYGYPAKKYQVFCLIALWCTNCTSSIFIWSCSRLRHFQNFMSRSGLRDQAILGRMLFETQKRLQHFQAQHGAARPSGNYDTNSKHLRPLVNQGVSTWTFLKSKVPIGFRLPDSREYPISYNI